jgi:hypothetical protein
VKRLSIVSKQTNKQTSDSTTLMNLIRTNSSRWEIPSNISYKSFKTYNLLVLNSYCDHRNFDSLFSGVMDSSEDMCLWCILVLFSMYPFSIILLQLGLQYSSSVERMSTQQKQQLAFKCLREVVRYRSDELDMYLCILSTRNAYIYPLFQ